MPTMSTVNLPRFVDVEYEKFLADKTISMDTKVICYWLYIICKILLALKGIG